MSVNPLYLELTTLPRGKSLAALGGNLRGYLGSCSESPPVREAIPSHVSISAAPPQGHTPSSIPTCPAHSPLRTLTAHGICTPQGPHSPSSQMRTRCWFY